MLLLGLRLVVIVFWGIFMWFRKQLWLLSSRNRSLGLLKDNFLLGVLRYFRYRWCSKLVHIWIQINGSFYSSIKRWSLIENCGIIKTQGWLSSLSIPVLWALRHSVLLTRLEVAVHHILFILGLLSRHKCHLGKFLRLILILIKHYSRIWGFVRCYYTFWRNQKDLIILATTLCHKLFRMITLVDQGSLVEDNFDVRVLLSSQLIKLLALG